LRCQDLRFGFQLGHSRRHPRDRRRFIGGEYLAEPFAGDFSLAGNCKGGQGNPVTHPQPHNQRSELSSRTRLRGLREPGSGGVSSSAMAPSMDESLKTLAESADSRFPAEA
jgi:hypothetical protein